MIALYPPAGEGNGCGRKRGTEPEGASSNALAKGEVREMRCRRARKLMGLLVDGGLEERDAELVREHLSACRYCALRYRRISEVVRELARLPEVRPTRRETLQLHDRLRREMSVPRAHHHARPALRWAAAFLSLLVVVGAAAAWTLLGRRETTTPAVESTPDRARSAELLYGTVPEAQPLALEEIYPESVEELVVHPSLVLSDREYTASELESYGEDIAPRMAFYSAYWYPIGGDTQSPYLPRLQEQLVNELLRQAARAGLDPGELGRALSSVLEEAVGFLLPCRAELARVEGREAWLITLSGPEDYLLFPDPQVPPALHLAARGGEESLRFSQSLLQELASYLIPGGGEGKTGALGAETMVGERTSPGGVEETAAPAPGSAEPGLAAAQTDEDFQAFLGELAAEGNPAEVMAALKPLNYEELLLLLQGNWAALASRGVNLSDFLVPPHRLWAVDRATGQVLWEATADRH